MKRLESMYNVVADVQMYQQLVSR